MAEWPRHSCWSFFDWRWTSFVAATFLGNFIVMYPLVLLERASARIPFSATMSMASRQALNAKYPHLKWVIAPAGGKGVFVRPDDYSPELAVFVMSLLDHQAGAAASATNSFAAPLHESRRPLDCCGHPQLSSAGDVPLSPPE